MYAASILFVTFLTVLIQPEYALANATNGTEILEEPKTLPLKDEKVINEIWQEDVHEVVVRKQRGTKEISGASTDSCRYTKGSWTDCDSKTNTRSRTLTLKKGNSNCTQTKTIQKKCKKPKSDKGCRYEKGTFSECQPNGEITRTDKLKSTSDSANCQLTRVITKKCNKGKQDKQPKGNSKDKKPKERKNRQ